MLAMRMIVDADACPVKKEIVAASEAFDADVVFVASYAHELREDGARVSIVQVDLSDQSADLYIANHLSSGDILITGDFGLAALGLAKGAYVMSPAGHRFTNHNIDSLLERRHIQAKWRRRGHYGKGPKPFTDQQRNEFLQSLTKLLAHLQENTFL